jgi:hypothetical protein
MRASHGRVSEPALEIAGHLFMLAVIVIVADRDAALEIYS